LTYYLVDFVYLAMLARVVLFCYLAFRMVNPMVSLSVLMPSISWPRRLMSLLMSSSAAGSSARTYNVCPVSMSSSSMRTRNTGSGQ